MYCRTKEWAGGQGVLAGSGTKDPSQVCPAPHPARTACCTRLRICTCPDFKNPGPGGRGLEASLWVTRQVRAQSHQTSVATSLIPEASSWDPQEEAAGPRVFYPKLAFGVLSSGCPLEAPEGSQKPRSLKHPTHHLTPNLRAWPSKMQPGQRKRKCPPQPPPAVPGGTPR